MNQVSQQKKREAILKTLAIGGFISLIIIIAWASVKLVNLVPSAFSSLASLAESVSVGQYENEEGSKENEVEELIVTSNSKLVNTKDVVNLSWSATEVPGSYSFSYNCLEGVSVDIVNVSGIGSISCDTNYNIGNTNNLSILVNSEKARYQDVSYTVSFLATNDTTPRATGNAQLTIINNDISEVEVTEEVVEETPTEVETETVEEETTPVYEQEFVYTIPTSNPNGRTDLATKFIALGRISGNSFIAGQIKQEQTGAIQFEVKNFGTKTSVKWTYEVTLPGGDVYESPEQAPLKPNERAVITVGFPTIDKATHNFKVTIKEKTDVNLINNQFAQTASFIK